MTVTTNSKHQGQLGSTDNQHGTKGSSHPSSNHGSKTKISLDLWLTVLAVRPWLKLGLVIAALMGAVLGVISPFFQKVFIDSLTGNATISQHTSWAPHFGEVITITLAFLAALGSYAFQALASYFANVDAVKTQGELAEQLYQRTLTLHTASLGRRSVGEIVAIYATDVPGATALVENSLPWGANVLFPLLTAPFAVAIIYDLPLYHVLLVIASTAAINLTLAYRQSKFFMNFKRLAAERTALVNNWIQHIRTLRVLAWMDYFEELIFNKRQEETLNRINMVTNGQIMNTVASSVTFILNIIAVSSLIQIRRGQVTPGELMGLLWILGVFLTRPFRMMPWLFTFTLDGVTSLRRLQGFLNLHNPAEVLKSSDNPVDTQYLLQVQGMSLQSREGLNLLTGVDFAVQEEEFVAIVGEVGSGKSLLLLSLLGENNAQFESYYLNQQDLLKLPRHNWKSHFSFVPQEGFIMNSSLRDNVVFTYEASETVDPLVEKNLLVSQFDLSFEGIGQGLNTEIGERGVNLSGGQRQRINLARAIHNQRSIVLMDDCLSAVDVDTERALVNQLLLSQWRHLTRILVTHRLNVLPEVDRIYFMAEGRIVAQGTFTELLATSQEFRKFVATLEEQDSSPQKATINSAEPTEGGPVG